MNTKNNILNITTLVAGATLLTALPQVAQAQTASSSKTRPAAKVIRIYGTTQKTVTLDARDAPVRETLQRMFQKAGVDYSLDNRITGYVTLKVTNMPFDQALRLVLQANNMPLTYTRTTGVYEIKPRIMATQAPTYTAANDNYNYNYVEPSWAPGVVTGAEPAPIPGINMSQQNGVNVAAPVNGFGGGAGFGIPGVIVNGGNTGFGAPVIGYGNFNAATLGAPSITNYNTGYSGPITYAPNYQPYYQTYYQTPFTIGSNIYAIPTGNGFVFYP